MAKAVFTTKIRPSYDDLPEQRYHFPATYLNQAEAAVGDWVVYYEPRRQDAGPSGREGRQAYFATARVRSIVPDSSLSGHYYALVSDFLEFDHPVPFRLGETTVERALTKPDGSTNKGAFGRAVRLLEEHEYQLILRLGFTQTQPETAEWQVASLVAESAEYERPIIEQLVSRPFRDAAFAKVVQQAYDARCALTGLRLINGGGRCEIEAAHIRPVGDDHNGPDSVRNGLALSRTMHWLFDRGLVSARDDFTILAPHKLIPESVRGMVNHDGRLIVPDDPALRPHPVFLRYHRERIYKGD